MPDVVVRLYHPRDRTGFVALVEDSGAMAPLGGPTRDPASLFARALAPATPDTAAWAIVQRESDAYVGHVFIAPSTLVPEPELGFVLRPRFWGRGLASQAIPGLIRTLHSQSPNLELAATVDLENIASQKVLVRAGFEKRGTQHDEAGPYLVYALAPRPSTGERSVVPRDEDAGVSSLCGPDGDDVTIDRSANPSGPSRRSGAASVWPIAMMQRRRSSTLR